MGIYSDMNAKQIENEKKYLGNLINGSNAGAAGWAKQQMNQLQNELNGKNNAYLTGQNSNQEWLMQKDYITGLQQQDELNRRAAIEQGVNKLTDQILGIDQNYEGLAQQAYINYRLNNQDMKQGLAAQGLGSTGLAESSALGAANGYENTLNKGAKERQNAINSVNSDIAELRMNGNLALAEGAGKYGAMLNEAYQKMLSDQREQERWNREFTYQQQQDKIQNEAKSAQRYQELLRQGITTPEMAAYYGISEQELRKTFNARELAAQKARKSGSGSRRASSSNSKTDSSKSKTDSDNSTKAEIAAAEQPAAKVTEEEEVYSYVNKELVMGHAVEMIQDRNGTIAACYQAIDYLLLNFSSVEQVRQMALKIGIDEDIVDTWLRIRSEVGIGQSSPGYR